MNNFSENKITIKNKTPLLKAKMKTPITYYGGKQNLVKELLWLIPPHKIYVEPYFWGGALFRAKEPSSSEIINDTNMNVVNFYEVLKKNYKALHEKIEATLHSRETYKKALFIYETPRLFADNPVIKARAFYVSCNQWFCSRIGSWWYDKGKRCASVFQNKIENFKEEMSIRLSYTQIEQNSAHLVIQSRDHEDAFFYCDPPYIGTNQWHYGGYHEDDFIRDLTVLSQIKWKFLLSNFPSKILDRFVKEHNRYVKTFDQPLSASHNSKKNLNKRKTEVLVANYPI